MNEKIIQTLMQEAPPHILADLSPEDSAAVASGFERLLRVALEKDRSDAPDPDAMGLRIGRRIIEKISEVAPEKRLEHIQQELLDREISDLDRRARGLAEQSLQASPDLLTLRAQARVILNKLEHVHLLLKEKGPDWEHRYGRTLSEALMDCRFVLGINRLSSLRLGRDIRFMKEVGTWPPAWYEELWLQKNDSK